MKQQPLNDDLLLKAKQIKLIKLREKIDTDASPNIMGLNIRKLQIYTITQWVQSYDSINETSFNDIVSGFIKNDFDFDSFEKLIVSTNPQNITDEKNKKHLSYFLSELNSFIEMFV